MNEPNISKRPRNLFANILILATTAILLIGIAFLWNAHVESKDQLQSLSVQNSRLQQELNVAKQEINNLNSGDSSIQTRERLAATRSAGGTEPVKEETETLLLQTPTVEKSSDGLTVRFGFEPETDTELPASITLVVRVPGSSASRIIALKAVGAPDVTPIVNASGNLGMIEGSPAELENLSFEFTVTAPVKATVRGSEGIIDFELDITPDACAVRRL